MIIGFGNNVVSSLAADITASQTTIQVMPGTGAMFANLLTYDYANSSNALKTYAKITLTDAKETVFEICHLKSVSDDTLTVVRGREGTTAKGWSLNDVIANFATRGSENQFVQIEHLQSGHYTAGVAGGTANALTLALPATYFVDNATDWTLRTPIVVYPAQNNTGAATLQLTLGGKALGTFPLYKGNKAPLVANDILKDVALVCLMDKTKTFFNVANPGAIYAGLGTAAFRDVTTSATDTTAGRVLKVGDYGLGVSNGSVKSLASIYDITCSGEYNAMGSGTTSPTTGIPADSGNTRFAVYAGNIYSNQYLVTLTSNVHFYVGLVNTANKTATWSKFYNTLYKPTASDVDAVSASNGGVFSKFVRFNEGLTLRGSKVGDAGMVGINFGADDASFNDANLLLQSWYGIGFYSSFPADAPRGVMGYIDVRMGRLAMKEQVIPGNYANFDARYQAKGNYTPAGQAYTKSESDSRFQLINTASKANNGWFKDTNTGIITQWGSGNVVNSAISFPIAFPNNCASVQVTDAGNGKASFSAVRTKTGMTVYTNGTSPVYSWVAKGY